MQCVVVLLISAFMNGLYAEDSIGLYKDTNNQGLNKLERIEYVEKYLKDFSASFKSIESKMEESNKRFKELEKNIEDMKKDFQKIESKINNEKKDEKKEDKKLGEEIKKTAQELEDIEKVKKDILSLKNQDIEKIKLDLEKLWVAVKMLETKSKH